MQRTTKPGILGDRHCPEGAHTARSRLLGIAEEGDNPVHVEDGAPVKVHCLLYGDILVVGLPPEEKERKIPNMSLMKNLTLVF